MGACAAGLGCQKELKARDPSFKITTGSGVTISFDLAINGNSKSKNGAEIASAAQYRPGLVH